MSRPDPPTPPVAPAAPPASVSPIRHPSVMTVESDIPEGMTFREYQRARYEAQRALLVARKSKRRLRLRALVVVKDRRAG